MYFSDNIVKRVFAQIYYIIIQIIRWLDSVFMYLSIIIILFLFVLLFIVIITIIIIIIIIRYYYKTFIEYTKEMQRTEDSRDRVENAKCHEVIWC